MSQSLTKRIETILRHNEDDNEILLRLGQLLLEENVQAPVLKATKTISELFEEHNSLLQQLKVGSRFIKTGFKHYDMAFGGFMLGELVIVGGKPGMGKAQLLTNISINVSKVHPVLYFSFDLNEYRLTTKFISTLTGIESQVLHEMNYSEETKNLIDEAGRVLSGLDLMINDDAGISLSNFRATCQKHIAENGVKLIVVDELQLMCSAHKYRNSRELEISSISRELKNIAKEFDVCVVAGSQLNRTSESRNSSLDMRPILSELRESGSIEQDADKVIFVNRPEYFQLTEDANGNSLVGIAELIIAKNKIGQLGDVHIKRNENFTSFSDLDYDQSSAFVFPDARLNEMSDVTY